MANKPEEPTGNKPEDKASRILNPTRVQLSRYEREARTRRIVVIGAGIVAALTLALIVAAVVQLRVVEPNRAVASVGGESIALADVQKRMKFEQTQVEQRYGQLAQQVTSLQQQGGDPSQNFLLQFYQQQLQQIGQQASAEGIAQQALTSMINDKLVRQEATKRGITVSTDEVQEAIEKNYGFYRVTLTPFPTDTPLPTPTATLEPTATSTHTPTPLPTATSTNTPAPTATQTSTPIPTLTASPTVSGSAVLSGTAAATATTALGYCHIGPNSNQYGHDGPQRYAYHRCNSYTHAHCAGNANPGAAHGCSAIQHPAPAAHHHCEGRI